MKALRDKRRAEGLVNLRVWVKPDLVQPILNFIETLQNKKP